MTRRAALAEQTALADHYRDQLDKVTAQRDAAIADAAGWRETARLQLDRNAALATRPPVIVEVGPRRRAIGGRNIPCRYCGGTHPYGTACPSGYAPHTVLELAGGETG